jgi:hypothetical protein
MHGFSGRPLVALVLFSVSAAAPTARLWAQVDYRNLDDGRPTRVTDAYPVERFAFELSVPYRVAVEDGVARQRVVPHLDYGVARNVMIGLGVDVAVAGRGSEGSHGRISALWNPRRETVSLPGLALGLEASGADLDQATVVAALLATRSFGRSRVHLNLAASLAAPAERAEPVWWAGIAWDRTLFRSSTVIVAELTATRAETGLPLEVAAGGGLRRQLTPTLVLHAGAAQVVSGDPSGLHLTLGFSRAFAIAGLMGRSGR